MKKAIIILLLPLCFHANAQKDDDNNDVKKGFQKDKLFTGGSLNLGLADGITQLGIAPQFGYSLTRWADAGIVVNLNYTSETDVQNIGDKLRQTIYGPAAFVRLFPLNFLFATAQYEFNFIHTKYIPGDGEPSQISTQNANSLLVGAGYAGGRRPGSNTYYFISISWDVLGDPNSPYVDGYGRSIPQYRVGYNIGLFQHRDNYYNNRRNSNRYDNGDNGGYR